ncbi:MAG: hypothetical protein IT380_11800 [Myxococcales bacterium]|nr:hypothetical protein [Myxococcales bacterium]
MRALPLILLSFAAVGCAHVDRAQATQVTLYEVMSDAEIARAAVEEALGELHEVQEIDAETGVVTRGQSAFRSRQERLDFERRVDALVRARVYGQGPTLELVRLRCEALQRTGWEGWSADADAHRRACDYGDEVVTLHSLFKKPLLQRAYVHVLLDAVGDVEFSRHARARLAELSRAPLEPYVFTVEAWERVDGFRPRG